MILKCFFLNQSTYKILVLIENYFQTFITFLSLAAITAKSTPDAQLPIDYVAPIGPPFPPGPPIAPPIAVIADVNIELINQFKKNIHIIIQNSSVVWNT